MKKKIYNQPRVETMQLMPSTIVLAGSPGGTIQNSGKGTSVIPKEGDIIGG